MFNRLFSIISSIIIISVCSLHAEQTLYTLRPDSQIQSQDNIFHLDKEGTWQYSIDQSTWTDVQPPFFKTSINELWLKCIFQLNEEQIDTEICLSGSGLGAPTKIYLNNNLIHAQSNSYSAFTFTLPKHYLNEDGTDELLFHQSFKDLHSEGFPNFSRLDGDIHFLGMVRSIYFTFLEEKFIDSFFSKTVKNANSYFIDYGYNILARASEKKNIRIEERFRDQNGQIVFRRAFSFSPGSNPVNNRIPVSHDLLWNPENPNKLSVLILELNDKNQAIRQKRISFGVRHLAANGRQLFLNGAKLQIRGISYHNDLLRLANKNAKEIYEKDLQILKKAKFNAVRFPHHIPDPSFVKLADNMGFLLFFELPIWRYPMAIFQSDQLLETAKGTIKDLRNNYANSPSFIGLSTGQQVPLHDANVQKFMLILNKFSESNLDILTYLSPFPDKNLPSESAADFYTLESWKSISDNLQHLNGFTLSSSISIMPSLRNYSVTPRDTGASAAEPVYDGTRSDL